ncbi:hypothetical protein HAU32_08395 [Weissella confusa]|uniref:Relaxase MobL n=1 Tax=Weissella fermenti TaxID=2987699 RepID=A0ABT6D687_9LACO|nr:MULTISPECIES: relaxase MobL [Weissella]MBJ7688991.1 hypothetical protein [Weissella confusa]MCW0928041.1 relaxase MobL [Weissella sp. LMG 11983]MDF9300631.1 relaxase MobL [Weissella sp. BK2]
MMVSILESKTTGSNPDIIVKQVFTVIKGSGYFDYTLDHNGEEKAIADVSNDYDVLTEQVRDKLGDKYDGYMDYSGDTRKTRLEEGVNKELLPMFSRDTLNMSRAEADDMRQKVEAAGKEQNIMWKTVISFSDDFLIEQGILSDKVQRHLDQRKLKTVIQKHMDQYLKDEGIESSAEWFGNIHLWGDQNKEHIHVHLGIFEPGKSARPQKFNPETQQNEPRGVFRQTTIDRFKANLWRDLRKDSEREKMLTHQIAQDAAKKSLIAEFETLSEKQQYNDLLQDILRSLPNNQKLWRAKSNAKVMAEPKKLAHELIKQFLNKEGRADYQAFLTATKARQQEYLQAFGSENDQAKDYVKTKDDELRNRLINGLFRQMKALGVEDFEVDPVEKIRMESPEQNLSRIEALKKSLRENKFNDEFDKHSQESELALRERQEKLGQHEDDSSPEQHHLDGEKQKSDSKFSDRFPKGSRLSKRSARKLQRGLQADLSQARRAEERALSAYEREQWQLRQEAEHEAYEHDR